MPTLIAALSSGKGTWSEVTKLISSQKWNNVFLITNEFGKENFKPDSTTSLIVINPYHEIPSLVETIKSELQGKITDFEIALNLTSGSGREHLAILEAVIELGLNFRLVTLVNGKIEVLGLQNPNVDQ